MNHPHADILRAIIDGEQVQDKGNYGWVDIPVSVALRILSTGGGAFLRIKPKPFLINGVECPRPEGMQSCSPYLQIVAGPYSMQDRHHKTYCFASDADLMTVFNAVVKPFEEQGK